jgi:hypothetical protein
MPMDLLYFFPLMQNLLLKVTLTFELSKTALEDKY